MNNFCIDAISYSQTLIYMLMAILIVFGAIAAVLGVHAESKTLFLMGLVSIMASCAIMCSTACTSDNAHELHMYVIDQKTQAVIENSDPSSKNETRVLCYYKGDLNDLSSLSLIFDGNGGSDKNYGSDNRDIIYTLEKQDVIKYSDVKKVFTITDQKTYESLQGQYFVCAQENNAKIVVPDDVYNKVTSNMK